MELFIISDATNIDFAQILKLFLLLAVIASPFFIKLIQKKKTNNSTDINFSEKNLKARQAYLVLEEWKNQHTEEYFKDKFEELKKTISPKIKKNKKALPKETFASLAQGITTAIWYTDSLRIFIDKKGRAKEKFNFDKDELINLLKNKTNKDLLHMQYEVLICIIFLAMTHMTANNIETEIIHNYQILIYRVIFGANDPTATINYENVRNFDSYLMKRLLEYDEALTVGFERLVFEASKNIFTLKDSEHLSLDSHMKMAIHLAFWSRTIKSNTVDKFKIAA